MIRELHDMGYQRIRFYPHIGGAGYWRYIITSSASPKLSRLDTDSGRNGYGLGSLLVQATNHSDGTTEKTILSVYSLKSS